MFNNKKGAIVLASIILITVLAVVVGIFRLTSEPATAGIPIWLWIVGGFILFLLIKGRGGGTRVIVVPQYRPPR